MSTPHGDPDPGSQKSAPHETPLQPEVSQDRFASLSGQERRLLNLVADGLTDKEIGDRLSIGERAVGRYIEEMLDKLGLETRTQAVLFAINRAFQSPEHPSAIDREDDLDELPPG
jgi:DNA-binding NarL/FixJ family response regulator